MNEKDKIETIDSAIRALEDFLNGDFMPTEEQADQMNMIFEEHGIDVTMSVF